MFLFVSFFENNLKIPSVASITFNPRKNILHNIDIGSQLNPKINNLVRDAFLSRICVPKRCPGRCRRGKGKGSVDRERSEGCVVGVAAEEMHLSQEKSAKPVDFLACSNALKYVFYILYYSAPGIFIYHY